MLETLGVKIAIAAVALSCMQVFGAELAQTVRSFQSTKSISMKTRISVMKSLFFTFISALMFFACPAFANPDDLPPGEVLRQGDTLFVRNNPHDWILPLVRQISKNVKTHEIKTVVFVNMGNAGRWLQVGGEFFANATEGRRGDDGRGRRV